MTSTHNGLRAEITGLHAQLEDLRQSKTVTALGRVASEASALLRDMDEATGTLGFLEKRERLAEALRAFANEAEADLAAAAKRSVELQHGPLAKELATEKATEDAVCPDCHGTKRVLSTEIDGSVSLDMRKTVSATCSRCKGSGRIRHLPEGYAKSRASMSCPECHGNGIRNFSLQAACPRCHGFGVIDASRVASESVEDWLRAVKDAS